MIIPSGWVTVSEHQDPNSWLYSFKDIQYTVIHYKKTQQKGLHLILVSGFSKAVLCHRLQGTGVNKSP